MARARGILTEVAFFGARTAERLRARGEAADLVTAKNVLAHVPDVNDFVLGIAAILKPQGVFTVEFPHLLNLLKEVQFDTIYHEHISYLSQLAVELVFKRNNMQISTSKRLRPTAARCDFRLFKDADYIETAAVASIRNKEVAARLDRPEGYQGFDARVRKVRSDLLAFLDQAKENGQIVVGYGAAAKGNTLLNYSEIRSDRIAFVCDKIRLSRTCYSPAAQSRSSHLQRFSVRVRILCLFCHGICAKRSNRN